MRAQVASRLPRRLLAADLVLILCGLVLESHVASFVSRTLPARAMDVVA
jgi:hypothetical protein